MRLAAWAFIAAIVFATLGPIQDRPRLSSDPQLERFIAFLALGFIFALAYPHHRARIAIAVLVCALALEAAQRLTSDRHGELRDALAKVLGGLLGVLAVDFAQRLAPQR